jgi:Na+(H+)/acetate symporter ActP
MVFVLFLFVKPPAIFHPTEAHAVRQSAAWHDVERRYDAAFQNRRNAALRLGQAFHDRQDPAAQTAAFRAADHQFQAARKQALDLVDRVEHTKDFNDTNYIFLTYVTNFLPVGVVGLLVAVIFTAAVSSSSGEINSLATVSVIDIYKRYIKRDATDRHYLWASRLLTIFWGTYAVAFANSSRSFGALIEAVNQVGSFFYGSMLGVFVLAFFFKRVGGTAAFWGVITGQLAIFATSLLTSISYLWFNVIGCGVVVSAGLLISIRSKQPEE